MSQYQATSSRRTFAAAYRWTDRELFYAFMSGALFALFLVIVFGIAVALVVP